MLAEVAGCVALIKGISEAVGALNESANAASQLGGVIARFSKANDQVLKTEKENLGRLTIEDSIQLQICKKNLATFHRNLKDAMLIAGLAGDYAEIMARVEESKLAHEKRISAMKRKQREKEKELQKMLETILLVGLIGALGAVAFFIFFRI